MNRLVDPHPESRFTPAAAFGIALILLGLSWTLHNLGLVSWTLVRFWPALLFILGVSILWRRGFLESLGGHLLILGGLVGLAGEFERGDLFDRWWPMAILWLGVILTLRALAPRPLPRSSAPQAPHSLDSDEGSHDTRS